MKQPACLAIALMLSCSAGDAFKLIPDIRGYETTRTAPMHPAIHNMGNVQAGGRMHAMFAKAATNIIDFVAYNQRNMRKELATMMFDSMPNAADAVVLEAGCGVGTLTRQLSDVGFENVYAIDTSYEMLEVARQDLPHVEFEQLNAVDANRTCDVAVMSMVMHELPTVAHFEILETLERCTRATKGDIWIVDIDPTYTPSLAMLSGEPYVLNYLASIHMSFEYVASNLNMTLATHSLIPGHVRAWVFSHR